MDYHREIANYVNWKGVSLVFLFRRNLLRRLVSELANAYDRSAKLLNGTHKSHVHSKEEVFGLLPVYLPVSAFTCSHSFPYRCRRNLHNSFKILYLIFYILVVLLLPHGGTLSVIDT